MRCSPQPSCKLLVMTDQTPQRIAVIGGGITGLAAAHRLAELAANAGRKLQLTLLEASPRLGGVFGTETVDGYRLETGADMFITDKPWGVDLCRRLGLEERLIGPDPDYRKSLILHQGRPTPTPEAFQLMVPGRLWPILTTPLLSPWGKLRLFAEPLIPRRRSDEDESLASFVRRRLGREALERIVQPLVGGIYTGDPELLSLEATLPRFRRMEEEAGNLTRGMWRRRGEQNASASAGDESASGARYGLFVSLQTGMGELQQTLIAWLEGRADVRLNSPVLEVKPVKQGAGQVTSSLGVGGGKHVVSTDAGAEEYDAVILAVSAFRAAELVEGWQPGLAAELRGIEYASSAVVVTGHRLSDVAHPLDAYGLVVPARERRQILAVSFLSRKFPTRAPEGRVILRTFVGGALQPELCELEDEELQQVVLSELGQILGVRGSPEVTKVVRYGRAMPQYHVGHLARVHRIEALQRKVPGLFLCGSAYRGVGIPDCIHDGEQAAEGALGSGL